MEGDFEARLYLKYEAASYRIKVFSESVWIERQQPRGVNLGFARHSDFYNGGIWHLDRLIDYLAEYKKDTAADE